MSDAESGNNDQLQQEADERTERARERFSRGLVDARDFMNSFSSYRFLLDKRANGIVGEYSRSLEGESVQWLQHMVNSTAMAVGGYLDRGVIDKNQARVAMDDAIQMTWSVMLEAEGLQEEGEMPVEVINFSHDAMEYVEKELWGDQVKFLKDTLEGDSGWKLRLEVEEGRARELYRERDGIREAELVAGKEFVTFVKESAEEFNKRWLKFKPGRVTDLAEEVAQKLLEPVDDVETGFEQDMWRVVDYWEAVVREIHSWRGGIDGSHKEWLNRVFAYSIEAIERKYDLTHDSRQVNGLLRTYFDEGRVYMLKEHVVDVDALIEARGDLG